jgi:hypothetical protein
MQSRRLVLLAAAGAAALLIYGLAVFGRPPMPVAFGTTLWGYECGFTVLDVGRTRQLGAQRAHGTFYVVTTRVVCPFGERYHWDPARILVTTNGCRTKYPMAQAAARELGPEGSRAIRAHRVLGAAETEQLVYDLPDDVEQPSLLFADTMGLRAFAYRLLHGQLFMPHRFNIRYD